jgi:hypothetical protein
MEHKVISTSLLDGHKRNYRSHPPEQIQKLKSSLERFQQVRSIVVAPAQDGRYTILAGHGIVEAAREVGINEINCDIVPAEWDQVTRDAYLVADNLHSQDAVDDDELLAQLLQAQADAGYDLAALGTDEEALRQMLEALGDGYLSGGSGDEDEDDFDEEPDEEQTRVKIGDVWQLGRHRIACGDSFEVSHLNRLTDGVKIDVMHADPPYGIDLLKKRGSLGKSKSYNPIHGDDKPFNPSFFLKLAPVSILWGANHFADKLPPSPFWLVWDKQGGAKDTTFASCELAWCSEDQPARVLTHIWDGFRRDSERGVQRDHPNQKPIAVIEWVLGWLDGETVLEPFLGSGSTLLACERSKKTCYGSEIDPRYVDVCLRRWEAETGKTAQLIERVEEAVHG